MSKTNMNPLLMIDLTIHFRGAIYKIQLLNVIRWVVPIIIIGIRVFRMIHD